MLALRVRQGLGDVVLGSHRVLDVPLGRLADDAPELLGLRAFDGVADGGPALLRYRLVGIPIDEGLSCVFLLRSVVDKSESPVLPLQMAVLHLQLSVFLPGVVVAAMINHVQLAEHTSGYAQYDDRPPISFS